MEATDDLQRRRNQDAKLSLGEGQPLGIQANRVSPAATQGVRGAMIWRMRSQRSPMRAAGVLLCGITDAGEAQGMSREQIIELDSVSGRGELRRHQTSRFASAPITGNWMASGCYWSKCRRANRCTTARVGAMFGWAAQSEKITSDERLRLAQRRGQATFSARSTSKPFQIPDSELWMNRSGSRC